NFLRTLATPEPIKDWSLTTLKDKLIKIGAKVVSHGRYVVFQMAEVAIARQMFQEILRLIAELRPQPPPALACDVRCHAFKSNRQKECVQMPGKMARSDPRPGVRVTRGAGSGQHLASVLQEGRENANIDAGLGFIWRISVLTGFAKWVGPWCSAFFPADRGPVRRRERAKLSLHRKVWIEYETLVRKKEIDLWCFC